MQRPPLFEANCFIYWKNRLETYVKSKDIDLWYIIAYGDYKPTFKDKDGKDVITPYEKLDENQKKILSKNNEAKMVTVIKEYKDLSKLSLDELVDNLKVYEIVLEKDLEIEKNKKEKYKSLALKARQVLSDDDTSSSDSKGISRNSLEEEASLSDNPMTIRRTSEKSRKIKRMNEDASSVVIQITSLVIAP
ncbi:hypothetical protein Tco_0023149, partial [Tanacetum coccineum]